MPHSHEDEVMTRAFINLKDLIKPTNNVFKAVLEEKGTWAYYLQLCVVTQKTPNDLSTLEKEITR